MAAITGAPDTLIGGAYSSGPSSGVYHVEVTDAQKTEAKTGRNMASLELTVKNDANHPSMEGKVLCTLRQSLPMPGDEEESSKKMQGMIRRMLYLGFGVAWPDKPKAFDPRIFVGRAAYALIAPKKNQNGEERNDVIAIAQEAAQLPTPKIAQAVMSAKGGNSTQIRRR